VVYRKYIKNIYINKGLARQGFVFVFAAENNRSERKKE